jgi:hypothetical protein
MRKYGILHNFTWHSFTVIWLSFIIITMVVFCCDAEELCMHVFWQVKADMRLAPSTRTKLTVLLKQTLDQCIESQSEDQLYIDEIRIKKIIPQTSSSTWALSDFKDVVILGM